MNEIRVKVLDVDGFDTANDEVETMKEARERMQAMKDIHYWQRANDDAPFHTDTVHTIQIVKDGVIVADCFPKF